MEAAAAADSDDEESHGKLVPVSAQSEFEFHLVFSNKTQTDGYCLEVWGKLTAQGVQVWQQQKNIPKDSDNCGRSTCGAAACASHASRRRRTVVFQG